MIETDWVVPRCTITPLKPKSKPYCICIPIINEGERILRQLKRMHDAGIHDRADIIICDGGSTDGSTETNRLADLGVRTLLVMAEKGIVGAQLRMGYAYALREGYEGILTMDGNDKDGIDVADRFIEKLAAGYDYVQGSRYMPGGREINTPLLRRIAIKYVHTPLLSLYSGFKFTDTTNGNRGYSKKLLLDDRIQPFRAIFYYYDFLVFITGNAPRLGFKVIEVPMERSYPKGKTPTKIKLKGNLRILGSLLKVLLGTYKPSVKS
jgi:dolichol-phosphate mannosyltransferase